MAEYSKVKDEFKSVAQSYMKRGEAAEISKPVLYEGKKYYEIIYTKKLLLSKNIQGRIIIDAEGSIVKDKKLLLNLNRMFYFYSQLFGSILLSFKKAVKDDEQIKKEAADYEEAIKVLKYLSSKNVYGADAVQNILEKFPRMKSESNSILNEAIGKIEEYKKSQIIFSEDVFNDLYSLYEESLILNFERIKFISTGSVYYNSLRSEVLKSKKNIKFILDFRLKNSLSKLENILGFYINVLNYYGNFLNYSSDRYIKHIRNEDEKNIEKYFAKLRND